MIEELYRSLDDWLVDQNSEIRASEVQGLLAGLMAAKLNLLPEEYIAYLAEYSDLQSGQLSQITEILETLFGELHSSWNGFGLDFELLIPDDQEFIEERTDALGAWCESFLVGLGLSGGLTKDQPMSEDTRQALEDLSEIARAEADSSEEPLEKAFTDISEHVRLAALLVATELHGNINQHTDLQVVH